mgnify:CR=1 FL=1
MCQFQIKLLFFNFFIFGWLFCATERCKSISKKTIRDPFNLPSKALKKNNELSSIKLLGVVRSANKFGAVLKFDGKVETVFLNDNFFGFKVLAIKPDHVELIRGKTKKRLFIE